MQHILIILSVLFISIGILSAFYFFQETRRSSHPFLRPLFFLLLFYCLALTRVFIWNYLITTVLNNYSGNELKYYEAGINVISWFLSIGMFSSFFFFGLAIAQIKINPVLKISAIVIISAFILFGFIRFLETAFDFRIQIIDYSTRVITRIPATLIIVFLIYLIYYSRNIKHNDLKKAVVAFSATYVILLVYGFIKLYFSLENILVLILNSIEHILFGIFPVIWYKIFYKNPALVSGEMMPSDDKNFNSLCEASKISRREQDVLRLLLQGKRNKEIQEALFISESTVKNHSYSIYRKLDVSSQTQLMHKFMNLNIG